MLVMFDSHLRNRCIRLRDLEVYGWFQSHLWIRGCVVLLDYHVGCLLKVWEHLLSG